jgi:4-nitrophenyl phosphatase
MSLDLETFEAVLLDLDGTIYHEEHVLPGAVELIAKLRQMAKPFACLTNSTMSPEGISQRLRRMGVGLGPEDIYSAAAAAADYVLKNFAGQRVFNLASEGMHDLLHGKVQWVEEPGEGCDAVVVGTPNSHYSGMERARTAMLMLRGGEGGGAAMVALCADRVYPSPRGLEFGVGAAAAMLQYASGAKPVYCGKPEPTFFIELCRRMGVKPQRCVLIGDNLESDVAGAKSVGMQAVLVLTGVSSRADVAKLPERMRPEGIIEDLRAFV